MKKDNDSVWAAELCFFGMVAIAMVGFAAVVVGAIL